MDSFEWNKIAGAVLMTLLIVIGLQNLGDALFATKPADAKAYVVEGVLAEGQSPVAIAKTEPPIGELLQTASAEKGARVAKKCLSCHSFESDGAHRIGPALFAVVGKDVASAAGFTYSAALNDKAGAWDALALNAFLKNPKKYAPGTSMAFIGLPKPKDRANIIAYLSTLKN